jgi:hypothetical protein
MEDTGTGTKLVNIWNLDGGLICGGLIRKETLLEKVAEHDGNVELAEKLWDSSELVSGPEWCNTVRVRVVDV